MARCGVAVAFGFELFGLQRDIARHVRLGVGLGQLEHRVVESMPTGKSDELERVAHRAEFFLEHRDRGVVEVLAPVERRRAVVRQHLVRVLGLDGFREATGLVEVWGRGLTPDQVGVRRVGQAAADRGLEARAGVEEALGRALAGQERAVALVDLARDERGAQ